MQVDPMAELMPMLTPYRHGFNNPVLYADPLGLFETRKEARRFRRENNMRGRIRKEKDAAGDKSFVFTERKTGDEYIYGAYSQGATDDASAIASLSGGEGNLASAGSAELSIVGGLSTAKGFNIVDESGKFWRGLNGQQYSFAPASGKSRPFYGNGSTGGRSLAQSRAAAYGKLGTSLGILSMGLTEVEYQFNMSNNPGPNLRNYLERKRMADQAMNGSGFLGLKGAALSLGYNGGYIIESLCNCNIQYNPYTGDFTPIEQTLMQADRLGYRLNY